MRIAFSLRRGSKYLSFEGCLASLATGLSLSLQLRVSLVQRHIYELSHYAFKQNSLGIAHRVRSMYELIYLNFLLSISTALQNTDLGTSESRSHELRVRPNQGSD